MKINVGKLGRARGLKGGVVYWPHNPDSDALAEGMQVLAGDRPLVIEALRDIKGGLEIFFEGILTQEDAKRLTHAEIFVERDALPPLLEGEWYLGDLLQLEARDEAGHVLGRITGTVDGSAQTLLEVTTPERGIVLVPAVPEFLRGVEAKSHVVMRPIPGMFNEDGE